MSSNITSDWGLLQQAIDHLSPSEKLYLIEEVARSLRTPAVATDSGAQKAKMDRLRAEMAALPVRNPADGFTNRQHDRVLYGETQ
jgi:hypothetical protein